MVTRKLAARLKDSPTIHVFEAGQAPENITGAVIRFKPDDVLFIDAVSLDAKPGSIHWIDWQRVQGFSASSHSLPLSVVIRYLLHEHACQVHVLGIQVSDTSTGGLVSPEIKRSVNSIGEFILTTLSPA